MKNRERQHQYFSAAPQMSKFFTESDFGKARSKAGKGYQSNHARGFYCKRDLLPLFSIRKTKTGTGCVR
jgi:hypothetical protein